MQNKYDLIVVGTSFSSAFFLKKFLENGSKSAKILVLERGIYHSFAKKIVEKRERKPTPPNYNRSTDTYLTDSDKFWDFDPNFGGSSNNWFGCTPRFMPNDFKLRSQYGVGFDWPISYADLTPYYNETEEIMAISGPDITPFPKTNPYPLPAHPLSSLDIVLQKEFKDLYISQPSARPSQPLENRSVCCSSASCGLCPVDSKFTIENSLMYLYNDPRVELITESQVFQLLTTQNQVEGVVYRKNNKDFNAHGETVVLGTNPIFNAHILLNSGDMNPNLGKGLCEQVGTFAKIYFEGINNLGGGSIITANGYMHYDGSHRKDYAGCIIESFNTPFIRNEMGKWRQVGLFKFIYEDIPSEDNKVVLSEDVLTPRIIYTGHSHYVNKGIDKMAENIDESFSSFPVAKVEIDRNIQPTESHICGTTRMSTGPEDGVIDKNMVHHQYRNLLVLGSGAFPAISPTNPTLTLSALSLMAADHYYDFKPIVEGS